MPTRSLGYLLAEGPVDDYNFPQAADNYFGR